MAFGNYKKNVSDMGGAGGIYLKIPEDKAVRLALLGEELTGYGRYDGTKVLPSLPGEPDSFPRFAVNVWEFPAKPEDGQGQVKILSSVKSLYTKLGELNDDLGGEINNYIIGIKKVGKKYEVRGIRPISVEEKSLISKQKLHDLPEFVSWLKGAPVSGDSPEPAEPGSTEPEDNIAF
jgi:hypothetical protein